MYNLFCAVCTIISKVIGCGVENYKSREELDSISQFPPRLFWFSTLHWTIFDPSSGACVLWSTLHITLYILYYYEIFLICSIVIFAIFRIYSVRYIAQNYKNRETLDSTSTMMSLSIFSNFRLCIDIFFGPSLESLWFYGPPYRRDYSVKF